MIGAPATPDRLAARGIPDYAKFLAERGI